MMSEFFWIDFWSQQDHMIYLQDNMGWEYIDLNHNLLSIRKEPWYDVSDQWTPLSFWLAYFNESSGQGFNRALPMGVQLAYFIIQQTKT